MAYTAPTSLILGFHGCEQSVGEAILRGANTHLDSSENDYDWLGHGIYFWENSPARALDWARQPRPDGRRLKKPFVLGAIINPGNCLNLMEASALKLLQVVHDSQIKTVSAAALPKNEGLKHKLDCALINLLCTSVKNSGVPYNTVRSVFVEGEPLYPTAKFHVQTHVQICVRDKESILGYFRPIPGL